MAVAETGRAGAEQASAPGGDTAESAAEGGSGSAASAERAVDGADALPVAGRAGRAAEDAAVVPGPESVPGADAVPGDVAGSPAAPRRRSPARVLRGAAMFVTALLLLFGVPWWVLCAAGEGWPGWLVLGSGVLAAVAMLGFPLLMVQGHARRKDAAALAADVLLGVVWVLFTWSVIGGVLRLLLAAAGLGGTTPARSVAAGVLVVAAGLLGWGRWEAMRVPRIVRREVPLDRLGAGLDGLRVAVVTDTHYGPIDRAAWSAGVAEAVNTLDADVVCHVGDIADGTVDQRREQAAPLGVMRAGLARIYVTGNHEYYSEEAQGWLDHMAELGWEPLHNRHVVVDRGGDRLVLAGIDDITAASSGETGHRADLTAALAGADPELPVLLLAHQPKQIAEAAAAGVDLQISGHTHGGQIWPFHYLVRTDQPVVSGLSRHGERTWLYTSRGTGFWGPPFRVFAPSEITLLTLRSGRSAAPAAPAAPEAGRRGSAEVQVAR